MFIVKATYRNETRKISFAEDVFPSYAQLCTQLYRVFPLTHCLSVYLSGVAFYPHSDEERNVMLGYEVRTLEEYDAAVQRLGLGGGRRWPHAKLRFTVHDKEQAFTTRTESVLDTASESTAKVHDDLASLSADAWPSALPAQLIDAQPPQIFRYSLYPYLHERFLSDNKRQDILPPPGWPFTPASEGVSNAMPGLRQQPSNSDASTWSQPIARPADTIHRPPITVSDDSSPQNPPPVPLTRERPLPPTPMYPWIRDTPPTVVVVGPQGATARPTPDSSVSRSQYGPSYARTETPRPPSVTSRSEAHPHAPSEMRPRPESVRPESVEARSRAPSVSPVPQLPQPCCDVAKAKAEVQTLLTGFKADLERIMRGTFGSVDTNTNAWAPHTVQDTLLPRASDIAVPHLGPPLHTDVRLVNPPTRPPMVGVDVFKGPSHSRSRSSWSSSWRHRSKSPRPRSISPPSRGRSPLPLNHDRGRSPLRCGQAPRPVMPMPTWNGLRGPAVRSSGGGASNNPALIVPIPIPNSSYTSYKGRSPQGPTSLNPPLPSDVHTGIRCDACNACPIKGIRYKCACCPDYDLCSACVAQGQRQAHNMHHYGVNGAHHFVEIEKPQPVHLVGCSLCNMGPIVGLRHKCIDCGDVNVCGACVFRGDIVKHDRTHAFAEIWEANDLVAMDKAVEKARKERRVRQIRMGRLRDYGQVQSDDEDAPPVAAVTQKEEPAVRQNAICDLCRAGILGDRYKCTHCPDFDSCASCFASTIERHPRHGFVKIRRDEDYIKRDGLTNQAVHPATCDNCHKQIRGIRYKCAHPDCPDYDLCSNCEALPMPVHPADHVLLKIRSPGVTIPVVPRTQPLTKLPSTPLADPLPVEGHQYGPACTVPFSVNAPAPFAPPAESPVPVSTASEASHAPSGGDLSVSTERPVAGAILPTLSLDPNGDLFKAMWPHVAQEIRHFLDDINGSRELINPIPAHDAAQRDLTGEGELPEITPAHDDELASRVTSRSVSPCASERVEPGGADHFASIDRQLKMLLASQQASAAPSSLAASLSTVGSPAIGSLHGDERVSIVHHSSAVPENAHEFIGVAAAAQVYTPPALATDDGQCSSTSTPTSPVTAPSHPATLYAGSDNGSGGSSLSLISIPSSPVESDDAAWEESRSQVLVSAPVAAEYVVPYASSSEDERA
ncbi:hypothetical protein PLICRDRAFT_26637 [Plicaturopsis crispa FD-325 SS-3]|nr:hypothetical protein PLICRDRAFT_26637 [Plicaturopsis crispa FD-325 SS-3]